MPPEELALINKYSRKELKSGDVYTFSVVLCDNDIDRDNEHFSDEALDKLAELYVGVTGIYDHDPTSKNQDARIYDCTAEYVDGKTTAYGAPYKRVVAKAYIPVCKSSEELIAMLDSGIRKEVSVSCGIGKCECSICGKDMRVGACRHVKGKRYSGKLCCGVLKEPTDAYEWSFIAVPSQKSAGVIKSFITLKPCPFCGREAEIRHGGRGSVSKPITSFIACKSCGARTDQVEVDAEYSSDEKAAKAWNSRAQAQQANTSYCR